MRTLRRQRCGERAVRRRLRESRAKAYPLCHRNSSQQIARRVPRVRLFDGVSRYSDPMGSASSPSGVDDTAARLLVTPLVGVAVPNLAGMIDHGAHSPAGLVASYAWFMLRRLRHLGSQPSPLPVVPGSHRVADAAVASRAAAGWIDLSLHDSVHRARRCGCGRRSSRIPTRRGDRLPWRSSRSSPRSHSSRTFTKRCFWCKEWESDRERGERLQRLNVEAELLALRSEVNPHTLFNNLNALSHLVEQRHPRASAFVGALAGSYRYLLRTRIEAAGSARRRTGLARSVPLARHDPLCGRAEGGRAS